MGFMSRTKSTRLVADGGKAFVDTSAAVSRGCAENCDATTHTGAADFKVENISKTIAVPRSSHGRRYGIRRSSSSPCAGSRRVAPFR